MEDAAATAPRGWRPCPPPRRCRGDAGGGAPLLLLLPGAEDAAPSAEAPAAAASTDDDDGMLATVSPPLRNATDPTIAGCSLPTFPIVTPLSDAVSSSGSATSNGAASRRATSQDLAAMARQADKPGWIVENGSS